MKKKSVIILMSLMMCLCCAFAFVGCGHTHDETILEAIPATCTESGWTEGKYCSGCGEVFVAQEEIPALGHSKIDGDYVSDGISHWSKCQNCDEGIVEETSNCTGGTATCTEKAICEVCNNPYGDVKSHVYTAYDGDGVMHWLACVSCGAEKDRSREAHSGGSATCSTKKMCTVCTLPYGETSAHTFDGDYFFDNNGHWKECSTCGAKGEVISHYGGNATCSKQANCEVCNKAYGAVGAHDYSSGEYDFLDDVHWRVCKVCHVGDTENAVAHSGGRVNCLVPAICEYCEQTYGTVGAHDFVNGSSGFDATHHWQICANCPEIQATTAHSPASAATCTAKAVCQGCGESYGEVLAHNFTGGTVMSDDNHHWKQCKNCSATDTKVAHTQGTAATCTTAAICLDCEKSYGNALGHSMSSEWEKDAANTKHWHKCLNAGCTYVEAEAKHSGGTATCQTLATCKACGQSYGDLADHQIDVGNWIAVSADGHAHVCTTIGCNYYDSNSVILHMANIPEATEESAKICNDCAYIIQAQIGHEHVKSSNYSYDGTNHWYGCTGCADYVFEETLVKHTFDNNCDPTCPCGYTRVTTHDFTDSDSNQSYHWTACSVCGEAAPGSTVTHYGGTANCTTAAICEGCNNEYGNSLGHDYNGSAVFGYDENGHWKKCSRCDSYDTANVSSHQGESASCTEQAVCINCHQGFGTVGTHNFDGSNKYANDGTNHWKLCLTCNAADTNVETHMASSSAVCGSQPICAKCGITYGTTLEHDFTGNWKSNATYHWRTCSRTGCTGEDTTNKVKHTGGTATCSSQAKCTACNKLYGTTSDNHTYSSYQSNDNYHWGVCKDCGTEDSANAVRHSGGTATCSSQAKCSICNKAYGTTSNHDYTKKFGSNSTQHWGICNGCGQADTNKYNHAGGEATCQALAKCSTCNTSYGSKADHSIDLTLWGYVERDGHARKCKTNGCTYIQTKNAHSWNGASTEYMYRKCVDCGYLDIPQNTNSNLKYFGYFHSDGAYGASNGSEEGSLFTEIKELDGPNYVMMNNTNDWTVVRERLSEVKGEGLKLMGGISLFEGAVLEPRTANSARLKSNWETLLTNYINGIKDYIKDGTFLGFMFDEPIWNGVKPADFRTVTKKIRDLTASLSPYNNGKGVHTINCMCMAELGLYTPNANGSNPWRIDASCNEYATGVSYDVYNAWDASERQRNLNAMKAVATHGQGLWACTDNLPANGGISKMKRNMIMQYAECIRETRYVGMCVFTFANGGDWAYGARHYLDYTRTSSYDAEFRQLSIEMAREITGKAPQSLSTTFHMYFKENMTIYSKGASVNLPTGSAKNGMGTNLQVTFTLKSPSGTVTNVTSGQKVTLSEAGNYEYTMTAINGGYKQSKTIYVSTRTAGEISTFDTESHFYDQHWDSDANELWCWPREIIHYAGRNGSPGCLRINPHATDGSYVKIRFGYNDSQSYNMSNYNYVSIWAYNTSNTNMTEFELQAYNSWGGTAASSGKVTMAPGQWTQFKISKSTIQAKGLNVSSLKLAFGSFSGSYSNNRGVVYLDDLMMHN